MSGSLTLENNIVISFAEDGIALVNWVPADGNCPARLIVEVFCNVCPLNDVAVTIPTVILGVPVRLDAVVAVPVKLPLNVVAVTIPTLILDGSLEFDRVPDEILSAFMEVILAPDPLKLDAVIIPDALILPVELIPTPDCVLGFEPTWK